jgi:hypothetical protein
MSKIAKHTRLRTLVDEFERLEGRLKLGGGAAKIEKIHKQGKLTARERIDLLFDKNSYQQEIGLLVAYDEYDGKAPAAAVVTSIGKIHGREALTRALLAADGLAEPTELGEELLARFGGVAGTVAYSLTARAPDYAVLAPDIAAAARSGDSLALELMQQGANYITAGLARLGWTGDMPLCLVGGVAPAYADYLADAHRSALRKPLGTALDGALALADRIG